MNSFNEPKDSDQRLFNKKFLIKLAFFMFFYRFYIMHIDQNGILFNYVDEFVELSRTFTRRGAPVIE